MDMVKKPKESSTDWPVGGGEMGELIRTTDWSATPFGARERWPASLRATVQIVVESRFPMALLWGRELILLYNDAYRVIAGSKHPRALGRSIREIWPEVWHINEPIFNAVLDRGETVYLEDELFQIDRSGQREDAYFTLCYAPVRADDGTVAGSLVTLLETTARGRVTFDDAGRPVVGVTQDISQQKKAEEALRESEERLHAILENMSEGLMLFDPQGNVTFQNPASLRIHGFEPDEPGRIAREDAPVSWKGWDESGRALPREEWPVSRVCREERVQGQVLQVEHVQTGRRFAASYNGAPIYDSAGNLVAGFITIRDITEELRGRRALEESEARFRTLADNMSQFAWISDEKGWISWYNKRWFEYTGTTLEEMEGWGWRQVHHPDHVERVTEKFSHCLETGQSWEDTFPLRDKDGSYRWFLSRAIPIHDAAGRVVRWFGTNTDITDHITVEEALQRTRHKLQTTLDSMTDGMLILDRDWCYTEFTETGARMLGLRREDLIGGCVWDIFPHARDSKFFHEYHRAVETNEPVHFEEYYPAPLNRWLDCHCYPSDEGLLVYFRDISERKHAEDALRASEERTRRSRDLLEGITEATNDLVAALDTDLRFIAFNTAYQKAFKQIFGPRIEVGTCLIDALAHLPDDQGRALDLWRRALAGETVFKTEEFGDPQRARRFFDLRFGPIRDASGRIIGAGEFASDVTERVQGEQALREAKQQLEEADRHKNEFLAVLSHELRNPLAPIRNSVHILEHAVPGGEQASRARQVIDRQAQHMTRLIEDLLDVTRISRGRITLQRELVDLPALARGTAEDHRELFSRKGIALEIDEEGEPLWVDGDRTRLAQVIGNLLSNAAKFTPRGGRTSLSVDAADGNAILLVRDNGVGMSEETLQHLFEPFVQAAQTLDRTPGGLGLGLALVKVLVEMHGGEVTASSVGEGKGSEVTVTLPLLEPASARPCVVPAPERTARARRVLVVEDNTDAAESLREALELGDHEVEVAYSGPEGVKAARSYKPDVVLCDLGLPGMDGYGVARTLRADPDAAVRTTFLVALSGYALEEDVTKAMEAGFDRHMAKPPSIEGLEKLFAEVPADPPPGGR